MQRDMLHYCRSRQSQQGLSQQGTRPWELGMSSDRYGTLWFLVEVIQTICSGATGKELLWHFSP